MNVENLTLKKTTQLKLKKIDYQTAFNSSIAYFNGDELAASVFVNKYALKDSDGNIYESTPEEMHRRIARELSRIENKYPKPLQEDEIFLYLINLNI